MISKVKRNELISDKFAYSSDTKVLVNALDLVDELVGHDHAKAKIKILEARIDLLDTLLAMKTVTYQTVDLKC